MMADINRLKEHLGMMGVPKTYEVNTGNLDSMAEEPELESSDPLRWPYHHMAGSMVHELDKILKFGVSFVEDLDGEEINTESKKKFMEILRDDLGINATEKGLEDPEKWYGKYVTIMYVFGIGSNVKGNYKASTACKLFLHDQKNPRRFILNHMLRWQYPNGTNRRDKNEAGRKLMPFVFTLDVLIRLSNVSIDDAYLSKSEILVVVTQAKTMDAAESVVEKILAGRENSTEYDSSGFPPEYWSGAARLFGAFAATGLIKYNRSNSDRSLELDPDSIDEAKNTLQVYRPSVYEWDENKDKWDKYHGIN